MNNFHLENCAKRLQPWIIKTPLVEVESLSQLTGRKIYLKLESMQRTGAFKFRGAMNYLLTLDPAEAEKGVITASSGNHGLAMALGTSLLGIKSIVVMPLNAPITKQERAVGYGARLILHGSDYDAAQEHASQLAEQGGYVYVPSFNHPAIIEGQATILAEILKDLPETEMVIVPTGGGGMLSGSLLAKEQLRSGVDIVGVEPCGAASMQRSLAAGRVSTLETMDTVADGVAVGTPGNINFDIIRRASPAMWQVTDEDILQAQRLLLKEARLIVETAGAVPVAGVLAAELPKHLRSIVCVISGANLDLASLWNLV